MSKPGAEHTESIRDSLLCLKCSYSLRGLSGDVVTCPECGERNNAAEMVAGQWNRRWYEVPLFHELKTPCTWALATAIVAFSVFLVLLVIAPTLWYVPIGGWFTGVIVWIVLLRRAERRFGNMSGVALALLFHVVVGARIAAPILFIVGIVVLGLTGGDLEGLLFSLALLVVVPLLWWLASVCERFIGKRCVRQYLRRSVES